MVGYQYDKDGNIKTTLKVSWIVYDSNGKVRTFPRTILQKLLGLPAKLMMGEDTSEITIKTGGTALIIDLIIDKES